MTFEEVMCDVLARFDELAEQNLRENARLLLSLGATEAEVESTLDWCRAENAQKRLNLARCIAEETRSCDEWNPRGGRRLH